MSAQVAADLRAAADVLERDGWTQSDYYDDKSGFRCVYGALHFVASGGRRSEPQLNDDGGDDGPRVGPAAAQLASLLRLTAPSVDLVDWNDAPRRRAAEVIAALRAAADRAEADQ